MVERLMCDVSQAAGPALLTEEQAAEILKKLIFDYGMPAVRSRWETLTPSEIKSAISRLFGPYSAPAIAAGIEKAEKASPQFVPTAKAFEDAVRACEPTKFYAALPAPDISPAVIAARQAEAEAMARKVAAPRYDFKAWARKLRAEWLSGRNLGMQQQVMGAEALGERWHMDNGRRECSPIYDAEAA